MAEPDMDEKFGEEEDERSPQVFIFANGRLPSLRAARAMIQPGDRLVAADGGARHLLKLGLTPDLVVGDMDSLTEGELAGLEKAGARLERYPAEKDESDLELALKGALEAGWRRVRIVGALGGRFDQMLGNLFLLTQAMPEEVDLRLDDGIEEVFIIRRQMLIEGERGDLISLLPLGRPVHGVMTQGLRYRLNGETLFPERTRGISNVMLHDKAIVLTSGGNLVCVHRRKRTNRKAK